MFLYHKRFRSAFLYSWTLRPYNINKSTSPQIYKKAFVDYIRSDKSIDGESATHCFLNFDSRTLASIDRFRDSLKICLTIRSRYMSCKRWKIGRTHREIAKKRRGGLLAPRRFVRNRSYSPIYVCVWLCPRWLVTVNVNHAPMLGYSSFRLFSLAVFSVPDIPLARMHTVGVFLRLFLSLFFTNSALLISTSNGLFSLFIISRSARTRFSPVRLYALAQSRCISMETAN